MTFGEFLRIIDKTFEKFLISIFPLLFFKVLSIIAKAIASYVYVPTL